MSNPPIRPLGQVHRIAITWSEKRNELNRSLMLTENQQPSQLLLGRRHHVNPSLNTVRLYFISECSSSNNFTSKNSNKHHRMHRMHSRRSLWQANRREVAFNCNNSNYNGRWKVFTLRSIKYHKRRSRQCISQQKKQKLNAIRLAIITMETATIPSAAVAINAINARQRHRTDQQPKIIMIFQEWSLE